MLADFSIVHRGDPLFVDADTGDIVPYSGSHGDEVYLIFVNEGGYYYSESGTGVGVAIESKLNISTARIVQQLSVAGVDDTFE